MLLVKQTPGKPSKCPAVVYKGTACFQPTREYGAAVNEVVDLLCGQGRAGCAAGHRVREFCLGGGDGGWGANPKESRGYRWLDARTERQRDEERKMEKAITA